MKRKYKALLPDWLLNVLAEREEDAQRLARQALIDTIGMGDFIVWQEPELKHEHSWDGDKCHYCGIPRSAIQPT